ncbi:MAG: outer membrane protein assembly factor BamB family protein [Planctomycetota bacterium]|jgi:outer membrane protein assembly factor BamB
MKRYLLIAIISVLISTTVVFAANQRTPIFENIGIKRGICVLLGDGSCELALELARQSELLIYIQLSQAKDVEKARKLADGAGFYGTRIFIDKGPLKRLHLANNVADIVVTVDNAAGISEKEALRVLRPGGKALLGGNVLVKAFPKGVDNWSHPFHGPDNNPQSSDQVALAPYLTQFFAEPWYCPMPQVTVTSGWRVFKAFGNRAFKRPQWPMLNTLIAMNAYNGTILWKRQLDPDFMIHRNTMIATPETLYLADAFSCKLFDTATGKLKDEIKVPAELSDGPVWKWMAIKDGTLYAMVGEKEPPGDTLQGKAFRGAGWPWWKIPKYEWGFGRTILAIDLATKKILWHHRESEPLDTRTMCMNEEQIFFYSPGKLLGCLNAKTGKVVWKTEDAKVVAAIAQQRPAQRAIWGFDSTAYAKCSKDAIYFAGPKQTKLVAVSARDGSLLWIYPDEGNFQLVLREEGLYAMGSNHSSYKFAPLTGEKLLELPNRAACTRATGSVDRVFVRGFGTRSWDVAEGKWLNISPMRPACHDGVVISGGHLYWGPWMCGCNLSLIGVICLGPAGDFNFSAKAAEADRLEAVADDPTEVTPLAQTSDDWPTYRKDNIRSTSTKQKIASKTVIQWQYAPGTSNVCTAPVSVGGLVFVGGSDGSVRALDAADGKPKWTAFTGGAIRVAPTISTGKALVGSADGWIYAFEATSGRLLWRFRAAPVERKIPVYGRLSSTWPVASGVLVEDGVAYAAAGIANYDGTHVYALDAASGKLRWQNNTSGNTTGGQGAGVSVQGDMLLAENKLYLAGGNRITLASYDIIDGDFELAKASKFGSGRGGPRGHDLFVRQDGSVAVSSRLPWYTRSEDIHYIEQAELDCSTGTIAVTTAGLGLLPSGQNKPDNPVPVWTGEPFGENVAVAVAQNAVIVAGTDRYFAQPAAAPEETYGIVALDIDSGKELWRHRLPAGVVLWGLSIDRRGRVMVALQDGRVFCYGPAR